MDEAFGMSLMSCEKCPSTGLGEFLRATMMNDGGCYETDSRMNRRRVGFSGTCGSGLSSICQCCCAFRRSFFNQHLLFSLPALYTKFNVGTCLILLGSKGPTPFVWTKEPADVVRKPGAEMVNIICGT